MATALASRQTRLLLIWSQELLSSSSILRSSSSRPTRRFFTAQTIALSSSPPDAKNVHLNDLFRDEVDSLSTPSPTASAPSTFGKSHQHEAISAASSADELFRFVVGRRSYFSAFPGATLSALSRLNRLDKEGAAAAAAATPQEDAEYARKLSALTAPLGGQATTMPTPLVAACLKNLVQQLHRRPVLAEVESFVNVVESFENEACWRFRDMELKSLVGIFQSYPKESVRTSQSCLFEAVVKQIELRCSDVDSPSLAIDVLYIIEGVEGLPESLRPNIESRLLELADSMTLKQIVTVLGFCSRSRRADPALLKMLTYQASKRGQPFTVHQAAKTAFSLASLSFTSFPLLEKICSEVKGELEGDFGDVSLFHLSSLVTSFAALRWKDEGLLDLICRCLLDKCQNGEEDGSKISSSLMTFLKSFAVLNHRTEATTPLLPLIHGAIDAAFDDDAVDLAARIDSVSSLTQLEIATPAEIDKVLVSVNAAPEETLSRKTLLKVMQLNAEAWTMGAAYSGAKLDSRLFPAPSSSQTAPSTQPSRLEQFRREVREYLPAAKVEASLRREPESAVAPAAAAAPPKRKSYVIDEPLLLLCGHVVDFVLVVDSKGNTLPVPDRLAQSLRAPGSDLTPVTPLLAAEDDSCVAVLLLDAFDTTRPVTSPIGEKAKATRHLAALGFKTCFVELRSFFAESKSHRSSYLNRVVTAAVDPLESYAG